MAEKLADYGEFLKDSPKTGTLGSRRRMALNFLTNEERSCVAFVQSQGKTFMLASLSHDLRAIHSIIRSQPIHTLTHGRVLFERSLKPFPGGLKYSDDVIVMYPQGGNTI